MNYEERLMHFNENHDPRNGQFTSSKDAKAIVKSTKKAMKNGVFSRKSRKYVKDIKSRVDDAELTRLIDKSRELFDEYRTAHMDWRRGLTTEKNMSSKYYKYREVMDTRIERSNKLAKNICNSIGINDPELEHKLALIIR